MPRIDFMCSVENTTVVKTMTEIPQSYKYTPWSSSSPERGCGVSLTGWVAFAVGYICDWWVAAGTEVGRS